MRRAALCLTLFLMMLVSISGPSDAQIPVTDAAHIATSVWAEIARYGQAALDLVNQAQRLYNQYEQIRYQLQALEKLEVHNLRDLSLALTRLNTLVDQADGVLYSARELEERFWETFPAGSRYVNYSEESYRALWRTMETARVGLEALKEITEGTERDLAALGAIEAQIEDAQGHEEVLEAVGDLLAWSARQQVMSERLAAITANVETVRGIYEIDKEARSRESFLNFLDATLVEALDGAFDEGAPAYRALPGWMPR